MTTKRQFMNVIVHDLCRWHPDWFNKGFRVSIVQKTIDEATGAWKKGVVHYDKPTIRYSVTHPDYWDEYKNRQRMYVPVEDTYSVETPIEDLFLSLAEHTSQQKFFEMTKGQGQNQRRKPMHLHFAAHGSDTDIASHYIDRYMQALEDNNIGCDQLPVSRAFADIEVDGIDYEGFPDEHIAPAPINIIGYFHEDTTKLSQWALLNGVRENPQIAEYIENIHVNSASVLCEVNRRFLRNACAKLRKAGKAIPEHLLIDGKFVDEDGDDTTTCEQLLNLIPVKYDEETRIYYVPKDADIYKDLRCHHYEIMFYETELEVITAFLHRVIREDVVDICAFWNMRFDILTIINRIIKLGGDSEELFSHPEFMPRKQANYFEDQNSNLAEECKDTFTTASMTQWLDQYLVYAALAKGSGVRELTLDAVLYNDIDETKLDIDDIKTLPYDDYGRFVRYNAFDIVPMSTLEAANENLAFVYQLSLKTRTHITKVLSKTTSLRNFQNKFYRDRGLILSNNHNKLDPRDTAESLQGAYVLRTDLIGYYGLFIDGKPSNRVFKDACDFDAGSLYPSEAIAGNYDSYSLIGRMYIMDALGNPVRCCNEEFETIMTRNNPLIGQILLGLPSPMDLIRLLGVEGELMNAS